MLAKQITYNTFVSAGARMVGLALSLITIGFITRYLGQAGFGQYATILAFLYFFTILSDLGLYHICIRDISRKDADEKKIVSNIFTIRFFGGLFIFMLAPIVSYPFPYPSFVKIGIALAAFGYWMSSSGQVLMGVFQKYLRMDKVALAEIISRLVQLGLVVLFIQKGMGFLSIVAALVAAYAINFILVLLFIRQYVRFSFDFDFLYWKKILKQSLPLAVAAIFTMFSFRLDAIMLSLMKPAQDVGIYNLGYKFLESLLFFPAMFIGLFVPLFSKYALDDKRKFKDISQKALDALIIFITPLIIGTLFISKDIVVLVGGPAFIISAGVLNILIFAVGIKFFEILFARIIITFEKQKQLLWIHASGALFNFIANLIFIPIYSYYGAAATTVFTGILELILMIVVLYGPYKSVLPNSNIFHKVVLAGIMMSLVFYWFDWFWAITSIVAIIIYFIFLFVVGGFSREDIMSLVGRKT